MTLDVKSLLSAADLMVDRSFTLSNSVTNAVLKLRVTLRVRKFMQVFVVDSFFGLFFWRGHNGSLDFRDDTLSNNCMVV